MTLRKTSRQMGTSALRWMVTLWSAISIVGCATPAGTISSDFTPNDREGMVYGRMELVINGRTVPPDYGIGIVKTNIIVHVSHYLGDDQLNANAWKAGEFSFRAFVAQDGRFVAKLPVGKYYCVEFSYAGIPAGSVKLAGWRTYAPIPGETLGRRSVVLFEVLPNKATYIGHVRHLLQIVPGTQRDAVSFDLGVADDGIQETSWLLQQYPNLKNATTSRLVVRDPLDTRAQQANAVPQSRIEVGTSFLFAQQVRGRGVREGDYSPRFDAFDHNAAGGLIMESASGPKVKTTQPYIHQLAYALPSDGCVIDVVNGTALLRGAQCAQPLLPEGDWAIRTRENVTKTCRVARPGIQQVTVLAGTYSATEIQCDSAQDSAGAHFTDKYWYVAGIGAMISAVHQKVDSGGNLMFSVTEELRSYERGPMRPAGAAAATPPSN